MPAARSADILVACCRGDHGDGSPARTATPVANHGIWRHEAVLSESDRCFWTGRSDLL